MRLAQFLGVLVVGPVVAIVALVLRRWRLALAALLVTVGKLAAERTVWHYVSRQRPGQTEPNAIVRGGTATSGVSFVSGHVILVTALAWVITPYLPGRMAARAVGRRRPRLVRPHLPRRAQPARRRRRHRARPRGGRCRQPDRRRSRRRAGHDDRRVLSRRSIAGVVGDRGDRPDVRVPRRRTSPARRPRSRGTRRPPRPAGSAPPRTCGRRGRSRRARAAPSATVPGGARTG